ncbi:hypothetical protein BBJ29_000509 [Phytophthora kernoviae]|uniref:H15 domain-containing protein n=1 Tax=Phytophthora kernoviae TaxID=325452 RepID=A0A3R7H1D2_9STRA|nr:hypothetical protein BBJ29_000509 [Phytophthora kernoviae]
MAPTEDAKAANAETTPVATPATTEETAPAPVPTRSPSNRKAKNAPKKEEPVAKEAPKAKKPKAKAPKAAASNGEAGPSYFDLIVDAIKELKERNGSSRQALAKIVETKKDNYASHFLNKALRTAVDAGKLIQIKGSYKLSPELKKPTASKKKTLKVSDKSAKTVKKTAKVAKKTAASKKVSAKKAPAKKAPAKKAPAKKTAAKKTPAKKAPAKKTAVKKTAASKKPTAKTTKKKVTKTAKKTAKNSADANPAPGIEDISFGVGCGGDMEYPTTTDNSTVQLRFAYTVSNPLAQFISVHFKNFNLPENDYVVLRAADPASTETDVLTYRGNETSGSFYSTALLATTIMVELFTEAVNPGAGVQAVNTSTCLGFSVDNYQYMAEGSTLNGSKEEVCGADNSQEARCYQDSFSAAFQASNAVIRLLIKKETGSFFCTGWLLGSEGHVITNHHCINKQSHASNTQFEFMAEGSGCDVNCETAYGCRGKVRATYSTLIYADEALDYALVKLPVNLSWQYGYLRLRSSGAQMSERIYVPQHPAGWGKRIAMKTDSDWGTVTSLTMGGCAVDQVAYYLDTQGGSSGSPLLSYYDNTVVALHHCGGCPNTAINAYKLVNDMNWRGILPANAAA